MPSLYHPFPTRTTRVFSSLFFFNDTATTEIYTLSLHDALPILSLFPGPRPAAAGAHRGVHRRAADALAGAADEALALRREIRDRKSTRLNSSHSQISYAVFCLKKKKKTLEPACRPRRDQRVIHA